MSGLYSPINKLMEQVARPKGTGAEYMAELQKKPGYKPAEAEDRDLQALMALPQMARAEFMEKLKGQANKYPLKMRELGEGQTHHEDYTLPGGENYREILLHTPMPEGQGFPGVSHHFGGTPNILASVMVKDRTTPEGKKMLHLEEIQSDWHQQGREKGYGKKDPLTKNESGDWVYTRPDGQQMNLGPNIDEGMMREGMGAKAGAIPHGPHAKDWHELALKAMIQHAAENGYDQIAINHGKTVADRYSLAKAVKALSYNPESQYFQVIGHDNQPLINENNADFDRIKELVGNDAASKLLETPKSLKNHYLETEGLTVGDKGMKKFYDQMVPSFLNKFGKKHGVQVQQGGIEASETPHEVVMDYSDPQNLYAVRPEGSNKAVSRHFSMHDAYKAAHELNKVPVHTFDITPAMREDILKNGIPRYAEGGDVSRETANANLAKMLEGNHPSVPKQLYHGTVIRPDTEDVKNMGNIHEFDRLFTTKFRRPSIDTVGTWMSDQPGKTGAEMYSGTHEGSTIYPLHASIKNPHETTFELMLRRARLLANGKDDGRMVGKPEVDALRKWLKDMGKDGIIIKHDPDAPNGSNEFEHQNAYIALEPTQIKSAIGNRGTYSRRTPDITKAHGGTVKEKVTMPPSMDVMQYELINKRAK